MSRKIRRLDPASASRRWLLASCCSSPETVAETHRAIRLAGTLFRPYMLGDSLAFSITPFEPYLLPLSFLLSHSLPPFPTLFRAAFFCLDTLLLSAAEVWYAG